MTTPSMAGALTDPAADRPTDALPDHVGLTVPPTLVTNDPDEARQFIDTHGRVIHKTLRWTPYERDGIRVTSWAEPVTADEVDDSLGVTPHLFQAMVDKVADLRVLIVGHQVFAVRIDSGLLDWRKDYSALSYTVVDLAEDLERALLAYLDHFDLISGSFDLTVGPHGECHWLELNPNGQWGWLEEETGLPMAAAFADLLTRGACDARA